MKGRQGLDQRKIAWLSYRMCLVTLCVPPERCQPTKATHGRREQAAVHVWCDNRYMALFFLPGETLDASEMPAALAASSTNTQTHILRLQLSHLRKTLQMCWGNRSALGGKLTFFYFVPNKQQPSHCHCLTKSRALLCQTACAASTSLLSFQRKLLHFVMSSSH